jgi:hypothetical protein
MLLRSPSATTTGHPLRVYAGIRSENKTLMRTPYTCAYLLILKGLAISYESPHPTESINCSPQFARNGRRIEACRCTGRSRRLECQRVGPASGSRCTRLPTVGEIGARRVPCSSPSTERVKAILDVAEARKFALADGRLAALHSRKETPAK